MSTAQVQVEHGFDDKGTSTADDGTVVSWTTCKCGARFEGLDRAANDLSGPSRSSGKLRDHCVEMHHAALAASSEEGGE